MSGEFGYELIGRLNHEALSWLLIIDDTDRLLAAPLDT